MIALWLPAPAQPATMLRPAMPAAARPGRLGTGFHVRVRVVVLVRFVVLLRRCVMLGGVMIWGVL
jgi:hypothetical protein